jgi:copper ion binding protein
MESLTLNVAGMSCGHCVGRVEKALNEVPGVEVEKVSIGSARVLFDAGRTSPAAIAQAVVDAGYAAQPDGQVA